MTKHPYESLPTQAFWKSSVAISRDQIKGLSKPKFRISRNMKIATAGSCFAQHVARYLRAKGFNYLDLEPAPRWLSKSTRHKYGFGLFSARFGNIYTTPQLRQLVLRAFGKLMPVEQPWQRSNRFFDPFRPNIQPNGYADPQELEKDRESHLRSVKSMFKSADIFIFTLGLTEAWRAIADKSVFPLCPGVNGIGQFTNETYEFVNYTFKQNLSELNYTLNFLKSRNPKLRFILTVSPVPLTATASGQHVLTATTYSKSVLRAVAGELSSAREDTDYFPSYEIITGSPFGALFESNLRDVAREGVDLVMRHFENDFCDLQSSATHTLSTVKDEEDLVCEERALEAYL
jgi:hypothetical protein